MYSVVGPRLSVAEGSRASFLSLGLVENPVLADLNTVAICIMVSVLGLAAWQGLGCLPASLPCLHLRRNWLLGTVPGDRHDVILFGR